MVVFVIPLDSIGPEDLFFKHRKLIMICSIIYVFGQLEFPICLISRLSAYIDKSRVLDLI